MSRPHGEYLFAYDFDLTGFDTFERHDNIVDVPTAVNLTTQDIFGDSGLALLQSQGGLRNRASSELIDDLLNDPSADQRQFLSIALGYMDQYKDSFSQMVPEGKGSPIEFGLVVDQSEIAEMWTRQKLSYMMGQIGSQLPDGQKWPRPTRGFINHWKFGDQLKSEGNNIARAIVSSGHEEFIRNSFNEYGLTHPDIIVSEDDIRGKDALKDKSVVKPAVFPLGLAVRRWRNLSGLPGADMGKYLVKELSDSIVYFGDDPHKDGEMAKNAGVLFGHFDSQLPTQPMTPGKLEFNNWIVIDALLSVNKSALMTGQSVEKIFAHD